MCICDEEAVGDSPSLLHTAQGGQGGRTLRGKQAHGAGKWSACSGVWVCDGEAVDCSPTLSTESSSRKQTQGAGKWSLCKCAYVMRKL